jgi:hypothetical protein
MYGLLAGSADIGAKDIVVQVGAIGGAAIAAFVAWLNARKTPSERLQSLIAIYQEWPDTLPGKAHVEGLIRGLLGEMWHRCPHFAVAERDAHPDHPSPRMVSGERVTTTSAEYDAAINAIARRHLRFDICACALSAAVLIAAACVAFRVDQAPDVVLIFAGLIGGFAVVAVAMSTAAIMRHWL